MPDGTVPIITNYTSTISLNATSEVAGIYSCQSSSPTLRSATTVNITIRQEQQDESRIQVIQSGFKNIMRNPDPGHTNSIPLFFVIFIPPNTTHRSYVMHTIKDTKQCVDMASHNHSVFASQQNGLSGIHLETYYLHSGRPCDLYEFVIEDENGTIAIRQSFSLLLPPNRPKVQVRQGNVEGSYGVLLDSNTIYSIHWSTNPDKTRGWLETKSVEIESIGVCTEESPATAQECGVLAVSGGGDSSLKVVVKPTKPCTLHLPLTGKDSDGNGRNFTTTLRIAVSDRKYFGFGTSGVSVKSIEQKVCQATKEYVGHQMTLQCLAPVCQLDTAVDWCRMSEGDCGGRVLRIQSNRTNSNFALKTRFREEVNISRTILDTYTLNITLSFPSLRRQDAGKYDCALMIDESTSPSSYERVNVDVSEIKPTHLKGSGPASELELSTGSTLPLVCEADGIPEPQISWTCADLDSKATMCQPDASDMTTSTLNVTESGIYSCVANNGFSKDIHRFTVTSKVEPVYMPIYAVVLICVALLVVGSAIGAFLWRWSYKTQNAAFSELAQVLRTQAETDPLDRSAPLNDQVHILSYDRKKFEIDRHAFSMKGKLLGIGEFGHVYRGELTLRGGSKDAAGTLRPNVTVAVKVPKDSSDPLHHRALVDELKIMCRISPHVNVLLLIGACTEELKKRHLFVLTEYCQHGSLKDYLIENRNVFENFEDTQRTVQTFLKYAYHAANGMEHLAGQNIIHRDLALRNLLLTDQHIVKIADFGMSRRHESIYRKALSPDVPVPIFWMALESLACGQYTQKSDVWSFGIVLWEMFNCGRRPYPDHEPDMSFRAWLRASEQNRMGPPKVVCEEMYDLMRSCWMESPDSRPTFSKCKRQIAQCLENRSRSMYVSVIQSLSVAWVTMQHGRRPDTVIVYVAEERSSNMIPLEEITQSQVPNDSNQENAVMNMVNEEKKKRGSIQSDKGEAKSYVPGGND